MKQIGRRDFIKYSTGSVALILLGKYKGFPHLEQLVAGAPGALGKPNLSASMINYNAPDPPAADPRKKFCLVIDVDACVGCRTCQWGCKLENNAPDTMSPPWIEIFELKNEQGVNGEPHEADIRSGATTSYTKAPVEGRWYMPVACNHCENPPCVKVCPVGATYKDKDGIVMINYNTCIGCRFCVAACPYSARRFNWRKPQIPADRVNPNVPVRPVGVVEKCTFCVHRTRRGLLPRCVEVCPVRARRFGDLNDPQSEVSLMLGYGRSFRLLEELNTGPNLRYVTRGKKWTTA